MPEKKTRFRDKAGADLETIGKKDAVWILLMKTIETLKDEIPESAKVKLKLRIEEL